MRSGSSVPCSLLVIDPKGYPVLQKLSAVLALGGLVGMAACAIYVTQQEPPVYLPSWLGIVTTLSMALGMIGLNFSARRRWRAEAQKHALSR